MVEANRVQCQTQKVERLKSNATELESGNGEFVRPRSIRVKCVVERLTQLSFDIFFAKQWDGLIQAMAEDAEIVEAHDVIGV